ncbi:hypothetical protein IWX90DRAFT_475947 [Phyllosticta citrichinensis]|uniref:Steroid 5-alpha reductase C-terminal domain-containing protein n=1 Tax=Phyllosticta citrichinensis TaxID=1130410 RepID=A0ABR1XYD2_9PEZI
MSWLIPGWAKERHFDMIERGRKHPTPLGGSIFIGLRSIEPALQYAILARGVGSAVLQTLHMDALPATTAGLAATTMGVAAIDALGLSPAALILLAMSVGAAAKQAYWRAALTAEEMPPKTAVELSLFNAVSNAVNTLAFCSAGFSSLRYGPLPLPGGIASSLPAPVVVGAALYAVGLALEWYGEVQRAAFKADARNAGKPCMRGLWAYARHVNYGGYTLWRAGFAMAGAGWWYGAFVGVFFLWDFSTRGVVVLDKYCSERYGEAWTRFKQQTPHTLIPFLW